MEFTENQWNQWYWINENNTYYKKLLETKLTIDFNAGSMGNQRKQSYQMDMNGKSIKFFMYIMEFIRKSNQRKQLYCIDVLNGIQGSVNFLVISLFGSVLNWYIQGLIYFDNYL